MKVGFVGMTHLGLNSAVASAERGFEIIGYDPDQNHIQRLSRGEPHVDEPRLAALIGSNSERIVFTSNARDLSACELVYVAPDVPTDNTGASDLAPVRLLIEAANEASHPNAVLVILSQVPPGFTRALEISRTHLYYQVETLIFGKAIDRALFPERFIVGCADIDKPLPTHYADYLRAFACPVLPMRYESAELAKISINCFLVASVSTTNTLAELCESIGADWSEISPALRLDKRIGEHAYLTPGLGIAGGNLERDLATVIAIAACHGTDANVIRAYGANSERRKDWVLNKLHAHILRNNSTPTLAILGLAYKEDTNSVKNSAAVRLIKNLGPFALNVYDPVVSPDMSWHPNMRVATNALEACKNVDACLIMTPWSEFRTISPDSLAVAMSGNVVIDPMALLDRTRCQLAGLRHLVLGAAQNKY